jgi:hypothetical protein
MQLGGLRDPLSFLVLTYDTALIASERTSLSDTLALFDGVNHQERSAPNLYPERSLLHGLHPP